MLVCGAGGGYLANVTPSDFWRIYEQELPESITGAAFLKEYNDHWDAATKVLSHTLILLAMKSGYSCAKLNVISCCTPDNSSYYYCYTPI